MTSTSHHQLLQSSSRPSHMIENYQQSFIPRRMPQASRKNEQDTVNRDDKLTPPLPPRSRRDVRKSTEQAGEFPPKGGISSLLKTSPNSSVLTQRYPYNRTVSNSAGSTGRSFSSLPRRVGSDKAKNNSQVNESKSPLYSHRSDQVESVRSQSGQQDDSTQGLPSNSQADNRNVVLNTNNKPSDFSRSNSDSSDIPPQIPPRGLPHRISTNGMPPSPKSPCHDSNSSSKESASTPEPQPLTRTNVTKHDTIWTVEKEADEGVGDLLSPPMKHLTPEVTAQMLDNFDPHDVLDSASDSSADTMIMMTTEEEKRNEESMNHSRQKYESKKIFADSDVTVVPECKNSILSKGNGDRSHLKVTFMSPKRQVSEDESLDDGYGTNSSSGTSLSSPLSSSSSSSTTNSDLENSCNQGNGNIGKRDLKPSVHFNGPIIKPALTNSQPSTRNTWAVRRRNKMVESQDNSLQEKLRQLAIIEEEENNQNMHNATDVSPEMEMSNHTNNNEVSSYDRTNVYEKGNTEVGTSIEMRGARTQSGENIGPPEDLRRFEGDLCDKFTDMDRNYRNYYDFDKTNENLKDDSKVLYFHQKTMKQNYGNDNYYNPHAHRNSQNMDQSRIGQLDPAMQPQVSSGVPMLSLKSMVSMDTRGPNSARSDYGGRVPFAGDMPGRSFSYQSNSSGVSSMGNMSTSSDFVKANTSCDNIFANGGTDGMPHKGRFISVDNVNQNGRRPFFASSADIYNMFQSGNNLATQIHRPASYRHSFHEMPSSGNVVVESSQLQPEQRPRAASTSVTMQSKSSWNLFGSMFSKKKSKSSQQKADNSASNSQPVTEKASTLKPSGKKSSQNAKVFPKEPSKPVPPPPVGQKQQYTVVPIIRTPKAQQMRNPGTDFGVRGQSQTLPTRGSYDHNVYKSRFKTVTTDEGDSQKLSTLV
ncbi:dentin sialophosphoprotein-like [Ylistrum balloti]|uniref:dentin sialophosphoprotein-like n=1 Tax=Ylistrum balloti TaxID=509963 RepID=UPI002905A28E|nr:dentin sialophosphoprotein-like [Ylistrum balloti]